MFIMGINMQISSASAYAGASALQSKQGVGGANAAAFLAETQRADGDPIAGVMKNYDLRNITPEQIDQLFDELVAAGHPVDNNLLMLSTRGAEFNSHIAKELGVAPEPNRPMNLVTSTEYQIRMARSFGDPTEASENFLDFLKSHDKGGSVSTGASQRGLVYESLMQHALTMGETGSS